MDNKLIFEKSVDQRGNTYLPDRPQLESDPDKFISSALLRKQLPLPGLGELDMLIWPSRCFRLTLIFIL